MIKKSYLKHKETIDNFGWRGLQIFGKQGITLLIFLLCAKLLTPYDFGIYNYIIAIIFFLIMFCDFGISTATSKYVTEYSVSNNNKLKAVLFNSLLIIFILSLAITVLILIIGPVYLKTKYIYIVYLLPLIFIVPMTSLFDGIYRGLKKFKKLSIILMVVGLFSLSFVYFLIKEYGLIGALISQNLFYFILLLALFLGYREIHFKLDKDVIKEIGKYSFVFGLATLGYFLFSRIDILILGNFGYISEIASYELINKIFMIVLVPFAIVGQVVAPNFTRDYILKKYEIIYKKFKKFIFIFIIIALFFGLLSYFIIPFIIQSFFSNYFNDIFIKIFLPTWIIYIIYVFSATITSGIIVATGYAGIMTKINILAGFLNIILSLVLLNYFGFVGVFYATAISCFFVTVTTYLLFYYKLKNLKDEQSKST